MSDGEPLDILVVGGGVTGAGIALDAATRGLRVGIIEAQDWSSGTSSRSSNLVHGGLRYLYQLNFPLVAESLRERGLLLSQNAPHLVKAQPLLWPLKIPVIERTYSAVGVGMYDALAQLAHPGVVPIQSHQSKKGTLALCPDFKPTALTGSIKFYDARVDDARLVIALVRSAVGHGALAASRTQMVGVMKDDSGRVNGAVVRDMETQEVRKIPTHAIINATGVWTEETESLAGTDGGLKVLASKGIHIVVPKDRIDSQVGLFLRTEKSVLFIIPWRRYWVIGTTDTKYTESLRNPIADQEDIDYLLEHANAVLTSNLTRDDVIGTYAGLRPLLQPGTKGGEATPAKVSREHTVREVAPGMVAIAGGKLTTYRQMAEDAVDFVLGKNRTKELPCVTEKTPLEGAEGYRELWSRRQDLATRHSLDVVHIEDMLDRYGNNILDIFESIDARPDLAEPLAGAPEYLRAEVAFAISHEGALHLEDILLHRVRLIYEHRDAGFAALPEIADLAGEMLGWDAQTKEREVALYRAAVVAIREAETVPAEADAQAIRDAVEPVRPMLDLMKDPVS